MARQLPSVASVLVGEADACRDGLRLLPTSPQQGVILETDSLEFVTLWRGRGKHRSEITPILGRHYSGFGHSLHVFLGGSYKTIGFPAQNTCKYV
jgi:hypothetical protein